MKPTMGDRLFITANAGILSIIGLVTLFPLYYVFVVSFTDPQEYIDRGFVLFPQAWSTLSYQYIFSTKAFVNAIGVSGILATAGTAVSLLLTSSFAYTLSRKRLKGRRILMLLVLLTTLFQAGIIPDYLLVKELGMINSIWSLIIPVMTSGWFVLLMKGFYDSIPDALQEAATIDGCNEIGVWMRIILPLSIPSMVAFGLFFAVGYWNTFFNAMLYINDYTKWPLQMLLRNMIVDSSTSMGGSMALGNDLQLPSETIKMAAVVVATVPILMVYPFLQKHFAKGAMIGSVKE
ncbi:carbohydrate ABC transporter permease [Paenibacillus sepulcri]|uniref:Carbohydrate ABC transporter permease n=1 Tax=Paenibacillus sepulcri TaxID=359917 RepID=A0ABS7BX63_9BACL|nr:carbohydrate ABC transporter permease [Paenibacillus sepulcri]